MGWCQEFGVEVQAGCDHSMTAAEDHCSCPTCGVVCMGQFDGCSDVWRQGAATVDMGRLTSVARLAPEPQEGPPPAASTASAQPAATSAPKTGRSPRVEASEGAATAALTQLVDALPGRVSALLAEATRQQQTDLLAATERLAVVLAKRVATEVERIDEVRLQQGRPEIEALTAMVRRQQEQLEQLTILVEQLADPQRREPADPHRGSPLAVADEQGRSAAQSA